MSDYQAREAFIVEQAFDVNSTTQKHPLGMIVTAEDTASTAYGMGEFIYLKGVASTAVGEWVTYAPDNWSTALVTGDAVGHVAVAMAATVASEFGWYQIHGKAVGLAASGYSDNDAVYIDGTAGTADSSVVTGDRIHHALGASARDTPSSGLAEFEIFRPFVNNAETN